MDKRSVHARFVKNKKRELTEFVGGNPNLIQRELIERAAMLALHIKMADAKVAAGTEMSEITARTYQGWCGAYTKMLRALNLRDVERSEDEPGLQQYLAEVAAE